MNLFATTSLSVTLCYLTMAVLVFIYAKSPLHRIWALLNFSCAIWSSGTFFAAIAKTPWQAELAWRWAYGFGMFVPYMFFLFNYTFCNLNKPHALRLALILCLIFIPLNLFSPTFVYKMNFVFNSFYYNEANIHYTAIVLYVIGVIIFSFKELLAYSRKCAGLKKLQASYLLWGFGIGWSGGFATFLPSYNINLYPSWNFVICFYILLITYAIFKHQLMDIRIIVQKSLLYTLLISILTVLFIICIYTTERFLQNIVGYQSLISSIFAASILAVTFIPLRNFIQHFVDYIFFRKTPCEMEQENLLLRDEAAQKEKFKAVAALASGIAHEVRNPITALKVFYEHFPEKRNDPVFLEKFNSIAAKEFDRIEGLIKQLLDFSKPATFSYTQTNISQLIDEAINLIHSKMIQNKITLKRVTKDNSILLHLDPNQIKQAILNILLNAIEAMPDGGVLTVNSHLNGRGYCVEVQDTGSGISKEALAHIFEPFYSEKKCGTGLGMAITKNIIDKHHGRIFVNRMPKGGTKFLLKFPGVKN